MIRISVIHPSYGRPEKALGRMTEWFFACKNPSQVEYIIALDDNDASATEYIRLLPSDTVKFGLLSVNIGNSRNVVQAMNRAAKSISPTTDIICMIADDLAPCPNWDELLLKTVENIDCKTVVRMIGVDDGTLSSGGGLYTHLFVTHAYYTTRGYLAYPEYTSVWADVDWTHEAIQNGILIEAHHILFEHQHYTKYGVSADDTTKKQWNDAAWLSGKEIYERRHANGFR